MLPIEIAKCESLLNDFCVVEESPHVRWTASKASAVCHRRTGIGADGLIVLKRLKSHVFRFRLFNADGSGAEWSGNGVRCAAAYLRQKKRLQAATFITKAGDIPVSMRPARGGQSAVSFARPMPAVSMIRGRTNPRARAPLSVDAGNPHLVSIVRNFDFDWETAGKKCQSQARKTHGVNVEFVIIRNRRRIEMRIFERGVGATPSSGSGALAAFAACYHQRLVDASVQAESPGGVQRLTYDQRHDCVTLTALSRVVSLGNWYGD